MSWYVSWLFPVDSLGMIVEGDGFDLLRLDGLRIFKELKSLEGALVVFGIEGALVVFVA